MTALKEELKKLDQGAAREEGSYAVYQRLKEYSEIMSGCVQEKERKRFPPYALDCSTIACLNSSQLV